MSLSTIPEALEHLKAGRPVIVADDENRENEGDIILSAALATPEWLAWTIRWSSFRLRSAIATRLRAQVRRPYCGGP